MSCRRLPYNNSDDNSYISPHMQGLALSDVPSDVATVAASLTHSEASIPLPPYTPISDKRFLRPCHPNKKPAFYGPLLDYLYAKKQRGIDEISRRMKARREEKREQNLSKESIKASKKQIKIDKKADGRARKLLERTATNGGQEKVSYGWRLDLRILALYRNQTPNVEEVEVTVCALHYDCERGWTEAE